MNLGIGYSGKHSTLVAEGIDFKVSEGELVGVVGANGVGKSTLLRTLIGAQSLLSGNIEILGKSLIEYSNQELATTLSVVLTEQTMASNLTVTELIALGRYPYTNWIGNLSLQDEIIVQEVIDQFKIQSVSTKQCFELSDGQLQKVLIARAIAQETPLIILDEPTTHLDLYHKSYIFRLLRDLTKKMKKTIVFSSHEIELAIQLCDKILLMTENEIFYDSPCKLIEAGVFHNLFPEDLISFNAENGTFSVVK
ncbi:MAG: ABC transporter ATP-binding protein [Flavobacteriaceae bacterium]|nr:ABC transporter ATP-binding protein [Flavobacteriaceae bacterium]